MDMRRCHGQPGFNQADYIADYNKKNYKMYQFRVRRDNESLIRFLDQTKDRNRFIVDSLLRSNVLTIKTIKEKIKPVMEKRGIREIYLFGSYARGEAYNESDVDILCEKGNIKSLFEQAALLRELKDALGKEIDLVFLTSEMDEGFRRNIEKDKIRIC